MAPSKSRVKQMLFFCRPSVPIAFNDPVKYTVRSRTPWVRFIVGCLPGPLARPFMTVHVSERIVEIPFVFANLGIPKGSTVLDLGCNESKLSLELANLGFKVLAADLHPYRFEHPNLKRLTGDFSTAGVGDASVDAVIAVSTLEHIGFGHYGGPGHATSDTDVVRKVRRVLKTRGQFLLSVPYGVQSQTDWYRVYDRQSLNKLLEDFEIEKIEYYRKTGSATWEEASEPEASGVASPVETQCVALVAAVAGKGTPGGPSSRPSVDSQ